MNKYHLFKNVFCNYSKVFFKISTNQNMLSRHCCVRRALLYVPGHDVKKLENAFNLKVDCIVMDCEDGVVKSQKEEARENIKKYLDKGPVTESDPEWSVRINPVQTPELCEADIEILLSAKYLPKSIILPKVDHVDQLQWFAEKVWSALMKRPEDSRDPIKLIMVVESAIAIITLPELCTKVMNLSSVAPIIPVGLIFGSDGLLASIGGQRTNSGIELLYARQKMLLVAKAFGLQAIDMVFMNYKDQNGFLESCRDSAILGYTGKQVIHPDQVAIAQQMFVPSRSRIQWAKNIVRNFNKNQEKETRVFSFDNQMSTVRHAEIILDAAKAAGKYQD